MAIATSQQTRSEITDEIGVVVLRSLKRIQAQYGISESLIEWAELIADDIADEITITEEITGEIA